MTVRLDTEETILKSERIMTTIAPLAFCEMIADAVFTAELMESEVRYSRPKLLHTLENSRPLLTILQIDRLNPLLILLFSELLVEDAKLLLIQSDTPETITAPKTIFTKLALTTVRTILSVINHVAVRAVGTLRAPLTADAESQATTADTLSGIPSVVHILRVKNSKTVVTVLTADCLCVVTVFRPILDEVIPRFTQKQILKLTDEIHIVRGQKMMFDAEHSLEARAYFVKNNSTF